MKNLCIFLFFFMFICVQVNGQNKPTIGSLPNDTVIVFSGTDYLILPQVDDGDAAADQPLTITAVSSNNAILEVTEVTYQQGDKLAVVKVSEKGLKGSVTINVSVSDADGATNATMNVLVSFYDLPGIKYEVHDAVFWQQVSPVNLTPVYSRVLQESSIQGNELDFSVIPTTVNQECVTVPPCTGHDFFTGFYRGYIVAPASGKFTFFIDGSDSKGLWLSTDANIGNAKPIAVVSNNINAGIVNGNVIESAEIDLVKDNIYAMYATHWTIHSYASSIQWQGPGIVKQNIKGAQLMPVYDPIKPTAPANLHAQTIASDYVRVKWNEATDNAKLKSYHVFLNGVYYASTEGLEIAITGLTNETEYSVFVVAVDEMNNLSFPSNILNIKTYASDAIPPSAPTSITDLTISDLAARIAWSGASDLQTAVVGYNVYVDNVLYNTMGLVYADSITIKNIHPQQTYQIQIEAVDASGNKSEKSSIHSFTSIAFDFNAPELGVKKADVTFTSKAIANASGLGINCDYGLGLFDVELQKILDDLKPELLRWGTLGANPLNFADYSGVVSGKLTYAQFLKHCNDRGISCAITTGIADATDWRKDPQTFAHFIEYLNGPATSTYGAKRAAEGITEPLFEKSKGLLIELGCEVWGGAGLHNAEIGADYEAYGKWCREMALIMKASPYYEKDKVYLKYSGRNPHPSDSYGLHTKLLNGDKGELEILSISGYLGGNMNYDPAIAPGLSEAEYYKDGFSRMIRNFEGMRLQMIADMNSTGLIRPTYFYESNMTTPAYNGRLGQAVTMIDYCAGAIENGSMLPTVFHLTGGEWKIVRPGENYFKLPLFHGMKFYNRFAKGVALKGSVNTTGFIVNSSNEKMNASPIGYYLYNKGENYALMLSSRDFANDYTVRINLPVGTNPAAMGKKYVISGSDYSTIITTIDSSDITVAEGMLISVPKHSIVFVVFTGTDLNQSLPLGYYEYKKITKVSLASKNDVTVINVNRGSLDFTATVEPSDAFNKNVRWSIIGKSSNTFSNSTGLTNRLRGSGYCDGNAQIIVRATAVDDTTLYDEMLIDISKQGTNCPISIIDNIANQYQVYPNPNTGKFNILNMNNALSEITISELSGPIIQKTITQQGIIEIDLNTPPGLYLLKIKNENTTFVVKLIKQ